MALAIPLIFELCSYFVHREQDLFKCYPFECIVCFFLFGISMNFTKSLIPSALLMGMNSPLIEIVMTPFSSSPTKIVPQYYGTGRLYPHG